jgi:outer membrane protein OmpA-like peptidoglycan-associated protein
MKFLLVFLSLSFQLAFSQQEMKHEVYFETDQFDIPETEHSRLLLFLSEIENMDIEKVSIYGFCDDRGSDTYNLVLSQLRADEIKIVFSNKESKIIFRAANTLKSNDKAYILGQGNMRKQLLELKL